MKHIYVAGHAGMVGSAIVRQLSLADDVKIITATRAQLELTNQAAAADFFSQHYIDEVYLGAVKVGGIHANDTYPADFIYDNLMVECNVI